MRHCDLHIQKCVLSGVKRQLGHLCRTDLYSNVKTTLQKKRAISASTAEMMGAIIPGGSNEPSEQDTLTQNIWPRWADQKNMTASLSSLPFFFYVSNTSMKRLSMNSRVHLISWSNTHPTVLSLMLSIDPILQQVIPMSSPWQGNTA